MLGRISSTCSAAWHRFLAFRNPWPTADLGASLSRACRVLAKVVPGRGRPWTCPGEVGQPLESPELLTGVQVPHRCHTRPSVPQHSVRGCSSSGAHHQLWPYRVLLLKTSPCAKTRWNRSVRRQELQKSAQDTAARCCCWGQGSDGSCQPAEKGS